jgi:hypothetical protein
VGPDGNVHPCSSRTLNYVGKRILPKRTCIEFLVDKWLDVSQVTMPVIVLTVCNELCFNLEDKAKRLEKKQPILANIFLLNNYHYILHTVSSNNMLERDLMLTFSAQLDKKVNYLSFFFFSLICCLADSARDCQVSSVVGSGN